MPPKMKISRDMVIEAAFEVARAFGAERINARMVAQRLGCSTQPVMYHFAAMEELKKSAYQRADAFHAEYLLNIEANQDVMLNIGLNYIRFAAQEPNLFRFLFQSGYDGQRNLAELLDDEALEPVLSAMQTAMGLEMRQTREIFVQLAMFAHGYASLIANDGLKYEEQEAARRLTRVFRGAILAIRGEDANETVL